MARKELNLTDHHDAIDRLVRMLGASVNVAILRELTAARRAEPNGGWVFLSDLAKRLDEAPGTVSVAIQKLLPLLEEKREKGRRYFRARVSELRIVLDERAGDDAPRIL
ncbi:MAG: hypothetical protein ACYDCK_10615 [Thermoplasmatota archaeon]